MAQKNINIDYLYEVYEDEYSCQEKMTKQGFIEWIESIIENIIREGEI